MASVFKRGVRNYSGIWGRFLKWAAERGLCWFHELDERAAIAGACMIGSDRGFRVPN